MCAFTLAAPFIWLAQVDQCSEFFAIPTSDDFSSLKVVALVGTGLAAVAPALLAYDLAGDRAGAVLGTAFAIRTAVYVLLAPAAAALVPLAHRKAVLIALGVVRASVALSPAVRDRDLAGVRADAQNSVLPRSPLNASA